MKKILGLDLGTNSIGWALISENGDKREILGMGSRIIPLSPDDKNEFSRGNTITKNQKRTTKRTQRKGYDRYQLRRRNLIDALKEKDLLPDESLIELNKTDLWGLRSKAAENQISLTELGRVLLHLNQKRGYKSSRSDVNLDKKDTQYVAEVKNRHERLKESRQIIGQFFYNELKKDEHYRIKQQVYPREAYIEEFDQIIRIQQKAYPDALTSDFIDRLRNEIIYYQRKLKSQKGLVSVCEFEGFCVMNPKIGHGKELFVGPKVAPRSSPFFQVCKIWETINNITLKNKNGETLAIPVDKKYEIFEFLDNNERLSFAELNKILNLKKEDGWHGNKQLAKGLQGNITKAHIRSCFDNIENFKHLLNFELSIYQNNKEVYLYDRKTGEILGTNSFKIVSPDIEKQPLYKLWHVIYSVSDKEECAKALVTKFNIPQTIADRLAFIDFTKQAFSNKSVKAMRKIYPYLIEGYMYSDACSFAGYNHSDSQTKGENLSRKLLDKLPILEKNSLRQPVVEKILNQMINLVNAIIEKQSRPDEIRIELARELKQSKEERNDAFSYNNKRERENKVIVDRINSEYSQFGIRSTRNNIIKWRLFNEISDDEVKSNATCIYCGKQFGLTSALNGEEVDIEHIIPKAKLFDDSQSNKTLSHRKCNAEKKDDTAYDYMRSKSEKEFKEYLERIDRLYRNRIIGKSKRDKLLMPSDKIPQDFIDRQLRETQYISKKSREILMQISRNVWSTSGNVTAYLRRIWGWDDVLMNLQLPKYKELGLTEEIEFERGGQIHKKEVIKEWSKRNDHRHHAIDALTIACTQQGYVQRINTLSSNITRNLMFEEVEKLNLENKDRKSLLENYIYNQRPFITKEVENAVAQILVSFKAGKKVASFGKRKVKKEGKKQVVQTNIIIPRGALSEESVYGKVKTIEKNKPLKYLFENPNLIFKPRIKTIVKFRLAQYENDSKKALASLKKKPVFIDKEQTIKLEFGTCYKEEIVLKYPIETIKIKDLHSIIDSKTRNIIKNRLEVFGNKEKDAFKDLEKNPVWYNKKKRIPIKTVRCFTGLSSVEPIKKDEEGKDIAFVKPGNNHHLAIYIDENGTKQQHICSFWHAVERKKNDVPVIITNPTEVWDKILHNPEITTDYFKAKLPGDKWQFELSMQQNEMFLLGLATDEANQALKTRSLNYLSVYLYRVQKLSIIGNGQLNIWFRHQFETELIDTEAYRISKRFYNVQSIDALYQLNPIKIRVNNLGEIENTYKR